MHPEPITNAALLRQLRDILAMLYPSVQSARRVAFDAEVATEAIDFTGAAVDYWHSLLQEAAKHNRVSSVLAVAWAQYSDNPQLAAARQAFLTATADPLSSSAPAAPASAALLADINPFDSGNPVPPERFYGRRSQIADVQSRIGALTPQCISIIGQRRSGKSSLLRLIRERPALFCLPKQQPIAIYLDLQLARLHTPVGIVEELRRGIERATGTAIWSASANADAYAVEDGLAALRDQGYRLIVLLDEFECIVARPAEFLDWGADCRAKASAGLFALVTASLRPLHEIYNTLGFTSPFDNIFSHTVLGALEPWVWQQLVRDGFAHSGRTVQAEELRLIDELAGGCPTIPSWPRLCSGNMATRFACVRNLPSRLVRALPNCGPT